MGLGCLELVGPCLLKSIAVLHPGLEEGAFLTVVAYWFDGRVSYRGGVRGRCSFLLGSCVGHVIRHDSAFRSGVGKIPSVVVAVVV
jgi:hypothetical protein